MLENITPSGHRITFRCSGGQFRSKECPAGLYLLYHADSQKVSMYETACAHDNHTDESSRGLSSEVKEFMKEKFKDGVRKPNAILALFREKQMKEPNKSKLSTFLKTLREEMYGSPTVSAAELCSWCENRTSVLTIRMSHLFCLTWCLLSLQTLTIKI